MIEVTSMAELKQARELILQGEIIPLPPFDLGIAFNARVRRLRPYDLIATGELPNELLTEATSLFRDNKDVTGQELIEAVVQDQRYEKFQQMIDIMVKAALLEPTVEELQEAGFALTEEQKVTIYNYTQSGVQALKSFRDQQGDTADS